MLTFIIEGIPTPWAAARVRRHGPAYSPKAKEKEYGRWQLKSQYNQCDPLACSVRVNFVFHMPIPKSASKPIRRDMLLGRLHPRKKPDATNLQKFAEDLLTGIVLEDDSQVVDVRSIKIFSETPKTIITVECMNDHNIQYKGDVICRLIEESQRKL